MTQNRSPVLLRRRKKEEEAEQEENRAKVGRRGLSGEREDVAWHFQVPLQSWSCEDSLLQWSAPSCTQSSRRSCGVRLGLNPSPSCVRHQSHMHNNGPPNNDVMCVHNKLLYVINYYSQQTIQDAV